MILLVQFSTRQMCALLALLLFLSIPSISHAQRGSCIDFLSQSTSVNESVGTVELDVEFLCNFNGMDLATVDYSIVAGTASSADYIDVRGTLLFDGDFNDRLETITVSITDDQISEPTETFTVRLSNAQYCFFPLGPNDCVDIIIGTGSQEISILDNDVDPPTVEFIDVSVTPRVAESAGNARLTLAITAGNPRNGASVLVSTIDGSAIANRDYTAPRLQL